MRKAQGIIIAVIIALGLCTAPAAAQDGGGGTRSVFTIGAGARAISMGGAFTAVADDASALFYNPAALKLNEYPSLMANHIQLFSGFADASYDYLGLVWPTLGAGSFGAGLLTTGTGGIRAFDQYSRDLGEISYRESQGIVSYGFDVPWRFAGTWSVGASIKVLHQKIGEYADTGTGVDLGLLYRLRYIDGLCLGVNLQDIVGARTKLVSASDEVYRTMMFGIGYRRDLGESSRLTLSAQVDMPEKADNDIRFGAEYTLRDMLSLRIGYDSESFTAGIGFAWRGYAFDYGYFSREEAGSSHPISITARIGKPLQEKIEERDQRRREEDDRRLTELFASRVSSHILAADSLRKAGELAGALDETKIALEYDPSNERAASLRDEIGEAILTEQQEKTENAEKALLTRQHFRLGLEHYNNNDYVLARAEWRNVLEIDPYNEQTLDYMSRVKEKIAERLASHLKAARDYEADGRLPEAMSEWNTVRMNDPENTDAPAAIERIQRRLDALSRDYREASRRLETIDLFDKAVTAFHEGRYEDATSLARQVLRLDPDHKEAKDLINQAERRMKPLTEEQERLKEQLFKEGMRYFSAKDYENAIKEWEKILEFDPFNESVEKNIDDARQRLRKIKSSEGG